MRTKKTMLNVSISFIYQIVAIICGLITPRLILKAFGSEYNGVVSSATQFLSMISLLTIGIAGPTRVALYKTLAVGDIIGTSRIVKATNRYMRKVAVTVVLYAIGLMAFYPIISNNELNWYESSLIIAIVSFGSFMEYFFGNASMTLLTADQKQYVYSLLQIIATILNTICVAVLIRLKQNIFIVKFCSAFVFALTPVCMSIYIKKSYGLTNDCQPDDSAIKSRGAATWHSIANIIHDNTDVMILTVFTNAKVISVYTVYYLVIGKVKMLMRTFTNGLEAAFGNIWAKGEINTLNTRFQQYELVMYSFVAIVFSCVGMLIVPFIMLYTKGIHDIEYERWGLAVLITIAEAMFCIRQPYLTMVQACGFYQETKNGAIFEAVINLSVSLLLVRSLGISGVVIGTLIANIFRTVQYALFVSHHIINRPCRSIICRFCWLIFTVSTIIFCASLLLSGFAFVGWKGWICRAIIVFTIACLVTLSTDSIFYRRDVRELIHLFTKTRKRDKA